MQVQLHSALDAHMLHMYTNIPHRLYYLEQPVGQYGTKIAEKLLYLDITVEPMVGVVT